MDGYREQQSLASLQQLLSKAELLEREINSGAYDNKQKLRFAEALGLTPNPAPSSLLPASPSADSSASSSSSSSPSSPLPADGSGVVHSELPASGLAPASKSITGFRLVDDVLATLQTRHARQQMDADEAARALNERRLQLAQQEQELRRRKRELQILQSKVRTDP